MRATAGVVGLLAGLLALAWAVTPVSGEGPGGLRITMEAPGRGWTGDVMTVVARLEDGAGRPVPGATVELFQEAQFMEVSVPGRHLVSLGEASADAQGVATLEFVPRSAGRVRLLARTGSGPTLLEVSVEVLVQASGPLYQSEIGIRLPSLGPEIAPGATQVSLDAAPGRVMALRLPGGTTSWLLLVVGVVATLWAVYLFVMYQVLRVSAE